MSNDTEKNPFLDEPTVAAAAPPRMGTVRALPEAHERGEWSADLIQQLAWLDGEIGVTVGDQLPEVAWLAQLARNLGLAAPAALGKLPFSGDDGKRYRRQLIKLAAFTLKAVESFDRKYPLARVERIGGREGNEGRA